MSSELSPLKTYLKPTSLGSHLKERYVIWKLKSVDAVVKDASNYNVYAYAILSVMHPQWESFCSVAFSFLFFLDGYQWNLIKRKRLIAND